MSSLTPNYDELRRAVESLTTRWPELFLTPEDRRRQSMEHFAAMFAETSRQVQEAMMGLGAALMPTSQALNDLGLIIKDAPPAPLWWRVYCWAHDTLWVPIVTAYHWVRYR